MAEFHDGDQNAGWAGWDFWAEVKQPIAPSKTTRYWIWINELQVRHIRVFSEAQA